MHIAYKKLLLVRSARMLLSLHRAVWRSIGINGEGVKKERKIESVSLFIAWASKQERGNRSKHRFQVSRHARPLPGKAMLSGRL